MARPDPKASLPIEEYAVELLPTEGSLKKLSELLGVAPDDKTRMGWERVDPSVKQLRSGLIDAWPNYLHMSLFYVTPPVALGMPAGELKDRVRHPDAQAIIRKACPADRIELDFIATPVKLRMGWSQLVIVPDLGNAQKVERLQAHLAHAVEEADIGKVRKVMDPQRAHITVCGAWNSNAHSSQRQLQEHQEQYQRHGGQVGRPLRLEFSCVAVTPWPLDRRDKRNRFYCGWAAKWLLGESSGKGKGQGKILKGQGKGKV